MKVLCCVSRSDQNIMEGEDDKMKYNTAPALHKKNSEPKRREL